MPRFALKLALGSMALALGACVCVSIASAEETSGKARENAASWSPKLYAFCMEIHDAKKRSMPEQAKMLTELGFDGVGYPLWLGDDLDKNLRTVDRAGLELFLVYVRINLKPGAVPYDPRVLDAIRKLKGRPVTVSVLLQGLPPADLRGEASAIRVLRELGDVAAESNLRVSIYHHTGDWTESLLHVLEVVRKADHRCVGANFNLCHWLKVDGDRDYRPVLKQNAQRIFAVTINGAKLGTDTWTGGLIQPLDAGDFDNLGLLATLRDIGYRGPIGLMCYGIPGDARVHLERSRNVWKRWKADWARP